MWVKSANIARMLSVVSILILVIVCTNTYRGMVRSDESYQMATHHQRMTDALATFIIHIQDAELGQRGFLLTDDSTYLRHFDQSAQSASTSIDTIQRLAIDELIVQKDVKALKDLADAKLEALWRAIGVQKTAGLEAALEVLKTDSGGQLLKELRTLEDTMSQHQQSLLTQYLQQANSEMTNALAYGVAGTVVSAIFFLAACLIISTVLLQSKRNESLLVESQTLLRQILAAHPTDNYLIAPDGHILEESHQTDSPVNTANSSNWKLRTYKALIQRFNASSPADTQAVESAIEAILASSEDQFRRNLVADVGGETLHLSLHARQLTINRQAHVLLCVADESESARARESAQLNEEMFRLAMDNTPIGMALVSLQGEWIRVNNAVCEIVGYSEEELLVTDFQTITHPDDLDKDLSLLNSVLNREIDQYHIEKRYIRKNGEYVWILLSVSLVRDSADNPLYFISQIQDIDARKKSESEISMSKERLELALRGGELGTWDWNVPDGTTHFDERWAEMLGYSVAELAPDVSTWENSVHPEDRDSVVEQLEAHFRSETESYQAEHRLLHKDGSWVWVLTKGKVIARDISGAPQRVCGTHLDITLQKNAQESLATFSKELERSNQELEDFAYIASHDLKEPLRGIRNYASFLLEDYEDKLDDDGKDKLHTLVKLTGRLGDFIDALLHYSKVGRSEFALQPINFHDETIRIIESLEGWIEEQNGHVTALDSLPSALGHPVLAAEIFRNLITNGIKYNRSDQKEIVVGAESGADGKPIFYVRDNGVGIPEKHQAMVFKIFKRLHGRDEYGGGTGAGLSITQKIVHRHGGRIWLESEEGVGTTFYFTLHDDGKPQE